MHSSSRKGCDDVIHVRITADHATTTAGSVTAIARAAGSTARLPQSATSAANVNVSQHSRG